MQLTLASGGIIENPTDDDFARFLPLERFAILANSSTSGSYLQFGKRKRALELEFQVEDIGQHFGTTGEPPTMDRIVTAFQKYAHGDASWVSGFNWQQWEVIEVNSQRVLAPPGFSAKLDQGKKLDESGGDS